MTEISIPEEEFGEPALNYWKPVPKPAPMALPLLTPNGIASGNENLGWPFPGLPPGSYGQAGLLPPYGHQQSSYPLTDVIHSYIQNQQIGLSPGGPTIEGERRRLSQCSVISADHVIYTLSANPSFEQDNQTMTDNMIQDEVTRAAKTLFSKRNRTLLHWLNPDVNKNQIKIDVNAAWESLPAAEKLFYISQVLGKFSPHVTSLMVNPQLEPSNMDSASVKGSCPEKNSEKTPTGESKTTSNPKVRQRTKKTQAKHKPDTSVQIKTEIKSEDEGSNDSGLVVDVSEVEKPKEVVPSEDKPRVKRKYTKRKRKDGATEQNSNRDSPSTSSAPSISVKTEPNSDTPIGVKEEQNTDCPTDIKNIKLEPKNKEDKPSNETVPRPKRKYVKRKLVRKKYKRREPKLKPPIQNTVSPEEIKTEEPKQEILQNGDEEMEMDLWIELGDDSILTNEEVDNFFNSIEDPDSLFRELGIIDN